MGKPRLATVAIRLPDDAWGSVEAEALVDQWLAVEGTSVKAGDPVVTVVLVKTNIEIPSPADGMLSEILVLPGETFKRGQDLGLIEQA